MGSVAIARLTDLDQSGCTYYTPISTRIVNPAACASQGGQLSNAQSVPQVLCHLITNVDMIHMAVGSNKMVFPCCHALLIEYVKELDGQMRTQIHGFYMNPNLPVFHYAICCPPEYKILNAAYATGQLVPADESGNPTHPFKTADLVFEDGTTLQVATLIEHLPLDIQGFSDRKEALDIMGRQASKFLGYGPGFFDSRLREKLPEK
jgi:hypothetical protein